MTQHTRAFKEFVHVIEMLRGIIYDVIYLVRMLELVTCSTKPLSTSFPHSMQ